MFVVFFVFVNEIWVVFCKLVCEFGFFDKIIVDIDLSGFVVYVILEIGLVFGIIVKEFLIWLKLEKLIISWFFKMLESRGEIF